MVPDQTTHSILVNKLITYLQYLTKGDFTQKQLVHCCLNCQHQIKEILHLFDRLENILLLSCVDNQIRVSVFRRLIHHIICFITNHIFYNSNSKITFAIVIRIKKFVCHLTLWFKNPKEPIIVSDLFEPIVNASNVIIMINEFVDQKSDFEQMCTDISPKLSLVQVWKILSSFTIDEICYNHVSKKILLEYKNLIKNSKIKITMPKYKINIVEKFL
ncbi:hypothetical protein M0812_29685 [Anaeramoeba flamelloides]|uniref:Dilute domain-containing protein n=1 Tax=Anaeramoeba flamelloides TaxID=1746091 RepID=A0AAV7Y978_9EUKA|nr:hypothetical protein M0812_29685 [Anaeramoeba flamelloides]